MPTETETETETERYAFAAGCLAATIAPRREGYGWGPGRPRPDGVWALLHTGQFLDCRAHAAKEG